MSKCPYKISDFPDNWIMPGEFSFCGTCGRQETLRRCPWQLRPACVFCRSKKEGLTPDLSELVLEWQQNANRIASIREELAESRIKAGVPALFWCHQPCSTMLYIENSSGILLAVFEAKFQQDTGKPDEQRPDYVEQRRFAGQLREIVDSVGPHQSNSSVGIAVERIKLWLGQQAPVVQW